MSKLIKGSIHEGGAVVENTWRDVADFDWLDDIPAGSSLLISLPVWIANRDIFLADARLTNAGLGVLLAPSDDPAVIAQDLAHFSLVAIDFPQFADGRGYSIARLLRERYGYTGELRAVGDVLRDQIYYMLRVGFDSFLLAERKSDEQSVAAVLSAYKDFSVNYQTSVEQKQPLFRRRLLAGAGAL